MHRNRAILVGAVLASLAGLAAVGGCGGDSGTGPGGGGGGGGGGTTISVHLPVMNSSGQVTFNTAGTVNYECTIHSAMQGTVTVNPTGPPDSQVVATVGTGAGGFQPADVTINAGGYVRWRNQDGVTHHVANR